MRASEIGWALLLKVIFEVKNESTLKSTLLVLYFVIHQSLEMYSESRYAFSSIASIPTNNTLPFVIIIQSKSWISFVLSPFLSDFARIFKMLLFYSRCGPSFPAKNSMANIKSSVFRTAYFLVGIKTGSSLYRVYIRFLYLFITRFGMGLRVEFLIERCALLVL